LSYHWKKEEEEDVGDEYAGLPSFPDYDLIQHPSLAGNSGDNVIPY